MKTRFLPAIAGLLTLLTTGRLSAQPVTFPDANLEAAIRAAIPKPSGDITGADMLTLTSLDASSRNIRNTTGLETALNLTHLVLNNNPVTNYSGISGLTNLTAMKFDSGSVTNITFLAPLTRLESLEIYWNSIRNVAPLAGLTNLRSLNLDWNTVTNLSVLSGLTNLTSLSLAGNSVSNISFVAPLWRLQRLDFYVNNVHDISGLTGLTNVTRLGLGWNGVVNPTLLTNLTRLEDLALNGNTIGSVTFLAGLTNLTGLYVDYTGLSDISSVTNLTRLVSLNVGGNSIHTLPDLSSLTNLNSFMLADNRVTNLAPVASLTALRELHVQRNKFATVAPLAACSRLERLLLSGNTLTNLAEISPLTSLRSLEMQAMSLTNIAFLAPLTNLINLDLKNNRIYDLTPLAGQPHLSSLTCEQNHLQQIDSLLTLPSLSSVNLLLNYLEITATSAPWNVITNLQAHGVSVAYDTQYTPPLPLKITAQPANWTGRPGGTASFSATATAGGTPNFRWLKDGVELTDDTRISGSATPTLAIANVASNDIAAYRLRIRTGEQGIYSADAQLSITDASLRIVRQPANRSALPDSTITFTVTADDGVPAIHYRWQKDNIDLGDDGRVTGSGTNTLRIQNVNAGDAGVYRVRVWDDYFTFNSSNAALMVVTGVAFTDPNLEAAVRYQLGLPTDPLTPNDLAGLTTLNASYRGITNLAGLEAAVNLESLDLTGNLALPSLEPLTYLSALRTLNLDACDLSDLSRLAGLTGLTNLSLANNLIADIAPLTNLPGLLDLNLDWNALTNPAALATMTTLLELHLNGNQLTNVPYLTALTNLTGLDLAYTRLADMSVLTNLPRLVWLNVGENQLTNLPDLSPLTHLATFMMAGNQIGDLTAVSALTALRELHGQRNLFTTITPLTNCPHLDRLLLSGNTLADPSEIGALTTLNGLEIENMGLANIDFLAPLVRLDGLNLAGNQVTDVSVLTNLPTLWWLSVERNYLREIGPLEQLPALAHLNLRDNYLATNAPSAAWTVITNLQARGVTVDYDPQRATPHPLVMLVPPANRSAFTNDLVTFSVAMGTNGPAPEYRWQKNGVDLADDARITGTDTDTLQIANLTAADAGFYRVRVWHYWDATNSPAAELKVITNVAFADAKLEQAVRDQLGIPTAPLTPAHLAGLTSLDASYRGLTNLAGLEAAANLTSLNLSGNPFIADFTPLTFLSALNNLAVNDAGLDNLNWAVNLRMLNSLQVNVNFIEDLSPLRPLTNLVSFSATENQLIVIDTLLDLPALNGEVNLSWNRLNTNATAAAWNVITNLTARGATVNYDPQNLVFDPPVITTQPASLVGFPGDNITFNVAATGSGNGLNYRWQKNGVNMDDAPRIGGVVGDTLSIDNIQAGDAGSYRVRVWDANGMTHSLPATLRVVTNVAFADPRLEQAVRDRLGIPAAPLTPADLAPMDGLDAAEYGITNISGIESAANLNWLSFRGNPGIGDYTPLTALPRLNYLELNGCGVSNIAFVASLPPLEQLHLWQGRITDISPLAGQASLKSLNLAYNSGITNREILNTLTNLEALWFEGGGSTDISFAAHMPNLREFSFEQSTVSDLTPLAGATNLVWLDMANNPITNAAPLAACTNLEWLSASGNHLGNLDFAARFAKLTTLGVNNSAITNISGITGLTNLLWLDIGWNPVANPAPLGTLTGLTDLHLWNLGLSNNLGFLATLTNLSVLGAGMNHITALPPYPNLNHLRYLNLDENPLASISFVSGMTNLTEFYLSRTGIRDLTPLTSRTNLHNLGLTDNGITDLSPLAALTQLRWITLWNNPIKDITTLSGLTNLNYADLRHNLVDCFGPNPQLAVIQTLQGRGANVEYNPQQTGAIFLLYPAQTGGQFQFTLHSAPNSVLEIQSSTNLASWSSAGWVTNTTGSTGFTVSPDTAGHRFFRASPQ